MATRSSVDDLIQPVWLGSSSAAIFFADSLRTNAWDLLRQFEQSACARKFCKFFSHSTAENAQLNCSTEYEAGNGAETIGLLRGRIVKFTQSGLSKSPFPTL
jgi:hypothetical protein